MDEKPTRADFGLEEGKFVFLMMYDVNSVIQRKNPQAAVEAFLRAFGGDANVTLLIKANIITGTASKADDTFLAGLAKYPNIKVMAKTLPRGQVNRLISLCDAYVSLHRSEGFGLGPAEAMYLGRPAIVTAWSGNMEYTAPEVNCPVGYELVKIDKDYGPYKKGMTWADPDIGQAADYMKKLVQQPDYYRMLSENGARRIREGFSTKALAAKARGRLQSLGLL